MSTYGLFTFFISLVSFFSFRQNVLSLLLTLELMMAGVFMMFIHVFLINMSVFILFLVTVVCEASMGLMLLILMIYFSTVDYINVIDLTM
uniref:NADH dehydrogenase subunit 4L n=1 Tax=Macrocheles glaber TaxID=99226 RepID=A0A6B9WEE6_9ACAR|nr:NADH dehydrogenase subunit 4L [Macrocheles glaber]QHQ98518.1 NADH dehydrogenase subunit 4L [Macrocheles glaber]